MIDIMYYDQNIKIYLPEAPLCKAVVPDHTCFQPQPKGYRRHEVPQFCSVNPQFPKVEKTIKVCTCMKFQF